MFKNKKGFTLIEMIIVILIMSLMLWLSMNFWSNRITELKYQTIKETFISDFDNIYSNVISSNYINQKHYDFLQIYLKSWSNIWQYNYFWNDSYNNMTGLIENMYLTNLYLDWNSVENLTFQIKPYNIWCEIFTQNKEEFLTWSLTTFSLLADNKIKKYCFSLNWNNCKLIEYKCNL